MILRLQRDVIAVGVVSLKRGVPCRAQPPCIQTPAAQELFEEIQSNSYMSLKCQKLN